MLGVIEELIWSILLYQETLIETYDSVCYFLGEAHLMGYHYHGHVLLRKIYHHIKNLLNHLRIER